MKIQTVYQDGVLKPVRPLRLKRRMVTITIPDEEIERETPGESESLDAVFRQYNFSQEARARARSIMARLAEVRERPFADEGLGLTEEEQERWDAFELRGSLREEEGRPE
jgi:predicted DNA-binding antitoxin AbrB/MazE fold protein